MDEHEAMSTNFDRMSALFGTPDPADVDAYRPWVDTMVATGQYKGAQEWLTRIQLHNALAEDPEGLRASIDATYSRGDVGLREAATVEFQEARSQPWSPLAPEESGLKDARSALESSLPERLRRPSPSIHQNSGRDAASHPTPYQEARRDQEAYRAEALGRLLVGRLTTFQGAASTSVNLDVASFQYRHRPARLFGLAKHLYANAYNDLQRAGSAANKVDIVDVATAAARNAALDHSPRDERMWRSRARRALGQLALERAVDRLLGGFPSASNHLQAARAIATARAYRQGVSGDAWHSVNLNP